MNSKKLGGLDRFLKNHHGYCTIHRFSDTPRVCSCGRDEALKEIEELRSQNGKEGTSQVQKLLPLPRLRRRQRAVVRFVSAKRVQSPAPSQKLP